MALVVTNRFGRRPGRGLRPWILLPKVLAVGLYFGGVAAGFVDSLYSPLGVAASERLGAITRVGRLMTHLAVPALLAAMGFGLLLLLQHPRVFLRMRWLRVKLGILAAMVPSAHWFLSGRLGMLRQAAAENRPADAETAQFVWGLAVVLVVSAGVIVLGRLKPRLGQNWAKAYPVDTGDART